MARKTKEEAQLTRDAILDAAEVVFRDTGVARTRLEDIAIRAGCTRGAVYWHFKNKTDVLLAMSDRIILPLYDSFEALVRTPHTDPLGAWRGHLLDSMHKIETDAQQQNVCDILINRCEITDEMEVLREQELTRSEFFIGCTRRMLELAREAGQVRSDLDLATAAFALHGAIHGLMRLWLRNPGSFDLTAMAAQTLVLTDGIRAR
jgi:TetR/AcrR family transcriptional regulator, acrAB operon repressor